MNIKKFSEKVRRSTSFSGKWKAPGKTSLPNDRSLPEDWTPPQRSPSVEFMHSDFPSTDFTPSTEFSSDFCVEGLPNMPPGNSDDGEEKREEADYYRRSPRVVFFDEEVLVRRVRPVFQIGGTIDRRHLWYQDDEYKEIMWKARRLVKRAHNDDENKNSEKYCLRGLEHVTNSINRRTKSNLEGRDAVLDEQDIQFKADVFPLDDNKIAAAYVPYTKSHQNEAIQRAQSDAEEVKLYQQSPSSTQPSSSTNLSLSHSLHSPRTPNGRKRSSLAASPFTSPTSPSSPSLVNKPGMMFTYVDKTIQYPASMKLETI